MRSPRLLVAAVALAPAAAFADGAFPDSMSIFLPPARPHEILVATTFGLLVSSDDGHRWELICEESITNFGETITQYQMGPPPASPLYAVSSDQLVASADSGCTWTAATGAWQKPFIT